MEADDDEDDEGDEAEEAGEENDRPYNLRQRKTVQRYEAPPIGTRFGHIHLASFSIRGTMNMEISPASSHSHQLRDPFGQLYCNKRCTIFLFLLCFLRASEQEAKQGLSVRHTPISCKKKPY